MKSSERHLLKGVIEVDECMIGGEEEQCQGRSGDSQKHKVLVMVGKVKNKKGKIVIGRAYAGRIKSFVAENLLPLMEKHIDTNTCVQIDKWTGFIPLKKQVTHMKQKKSKQGENFPLIHLHIMNLKGWLRGLHHHCSSKHLTAYLNEYHFRFNRRIILYPKP